jgi:putative hemolysin
MTTLLLSAPGPATTGAPAYTLRLAAHADEVAAAQRLRHDVFAGEIGARLHTLLPGHDVDAFDEFCDHLIVIDERDGAVVGTYRLLPPGRTENRYAADEFDIDALSPIAASLVETGRSCIHPAHRSGAVINLIWAGIARYMHLYGYRYVGGCASVDVRAGDTTANAVWSLARSRYASPEPWRVRPYRPWMPEGTSAAAGGRVTATDARRLVPPLLQGYVRLGAWLCGAPAYDPDFGCADFYVLLDVQRIDARYMKHFLGDVDGRR